MLTGGIKVEGRKNRKPIRYEVNEKGCWNCISHCNRYGYPAIRIKNETLIMSRYIYERFIKKIPQGLSILHSCDNPSCINPYHSRIGNDQDNADDKVSRNRQCKIKGEKRWNSKLTQTQANEIRKDNRGCRIIGLDYGVGRSTVNAIKNNKRWEII